MTNKREIERERGVMIYMYMYDSNMIWYILLGLHTNTIFILYMCSACILIAKLKVKRYIMYMCKLNVTIMYMYTVAYTVLYLVVIQ